MSLQDMLGLYLPCGGNVGSVSTSSVYNTGYLVSMSTDVVVTTSISATSASRPLSANCSSNTVSTTEISDTIQSPPQKRSKLISGEVDTGDNKSSGDTRGDQQQHVMMEVDNAEGGANGAAHENGVLAVDGNNSGQGLYDEQLYSRQTIALGRTAMERLRAAKVLIAGMGGLGIEIAKNLVLGGVKEVTIQDTKTASWNDLSAQYYLTEKDLGKNRGTVSRKLLADLNDTVIVRSIDVELTPVIIKDFQLVILTDHTFEKQMEISKWTRAAGKYLLVANTNGLFGKIFADFGENFVVDDVNGEPCQEGLIEYVDRETGDVTTLEESKHNLEDGDTVTFADVQGMIELNDCKPLKVKVLKPNKFNIGDISGFTQFKEGGRFKQVKTQKKLNFLSLEEAVQKPEFLISDYAKFERPNLLHIGWLALDKFVQTQGRKPISYNEAGEFESILILADAAAVLAIFHELNASHPAKAETVDENLIRALSYQAQGNLAPMNSFIGGAVAQEAMKAVTQIFHPIYQWIYFDAHECLLPSLVLNEENCKPQNSRYDGQIAVFGKQFQEAVMKQRWFIVGTGAIGCEHLKNFAMMGLGAGKDGKLTVTDMDTIELSNLNRQFLFRRDDVGKLKAAVASHAAKQFNPALNIEFMADRVGPETEATFSDNFFAQLNGVANALDNVDARTYMDRRCVYYRLPLLESGTLGPKGNTQVIYPFLTESYSSSHDPPETTIPICTLSNFPSTINHTITYARERIFEGLFTVPAQLANELATNARGFYDRLDKLSVNQKIDIMEAVKKTLIDDRPETAEDCIAWARQQFAEFFHNAIAQLLYNFPPEQTTSHGAKFWSGSKRCPHPLIFDANNAEHIEFVWASSILRAHMYGIKPITDRADVARIAKAVEIPPFAPRSGVKIAVTEQEAAAAAEQSENGADEQQLQNLQIALAKLGNKKIAVNLMDFEKDDETNYHMDFMVAASNLRAENYNIEKADKLKTKQIAGRIIPAIATTTAAVSGLVGLELYKIIAGDGSCSLECFKNGFLNLALPFFGFSEPIAAPVKKYYETSWTLWDCIEVQGEMTLKEFMDHLKEKYRLEVSMLSQGVSMLYSFFMNAEKTKTRMNMKISELVESITNKPIPPHVKALVLEAMCNDEDGEDLEVPYFKYLLPGR